MSSLFCKFDIVWVAVVDSTPSASNSVLCFDGWSKSWDLGDVDVHPTCFPHKHKGSISDAALPKASLLITCSSCGNGWLIIKPNVEQVCLVHSAYWRNKRWITSENKNYCSYPTRDNYFVSSTLLTQHFSPLQHYHSFISKDCLFNLWCNVKICRDHFFFWMPANSK